jgi:hypothetical protein
MEDSGWKMEILNELKSELIVGRSAVPQGYYISGRRSIRMEG